MTIMCTPLLGAYSCAKTEDYMKSKNKHNILPGQKFGMLTVVSSDRHKGYLSYECKCDCGNTTFATSYELICGQRKSCGCISTCHRFPEIQKHDWSKELDVIHIVEDAVFDTYGMDKDTLWSDNRHRNCSYIRHVAFYIIYRETGCNCCNIAFLLNGKKHYSSIRNSLKVAPLLMIYSDFKFMYDKIKTKYDELWNMKNSKN